MMILIASFDIFQYLERFLVGGRLNLYLLETTLQSAILFYGITILVKCCRTNALYGTTCQCWFQYVCSIHRACSRTSTYHGVNLVDEDDDVRILFQFLDQHLHTFLELSTIFRASYYTRHIQRDDTFAEQHWRTVVADNHLCQSLDDGTLTNTRLTNQYGVVLLAASKDFYDALYLAFTTDTGVKFPFLSLLGEVCSEVVDDRCLRLGLLLGSSGSFSCGRTIGYTTRSFVLLLLFVVFVG